MPADRTLAERLLWTVKVAVSLWRQGERPGQAWRLANRAWCPSDWHNMPAGDVAWWIRN